VIALISLIFVAIDTFLSFHITLSFERVPVAIAIRVFISDVDFPSFVIVALRY